MKSFYCQTNPNPQVPFTTGKTYHAFQQSGNGFLVYDDKGIARFLGGEKNPRFRVGEYPSKLHKGIFHPLFAEFEAY